MNTQENAAPAVVITGASTGIGLACAVGLDRRGWRVFAGVRREADAERLRAGASPRMTPLHLDVTDSASLAAAAAQVDQAVGPAGLAGLVNNAGIVVAGPLELLPLEELRRQLEVNVVGQIATTQVFLPLLRRAKGRIVNMGSLNGRVSAPYLGAYAASKHALEALNDALRVELRTWGIQVSLVEPGSIATPIWDKSFAAANRLEATFSSAVVDPYRIDLNAIRLGIRKIADASLPVERVVRAVLHALCARRPKTRYPVGLKTNLAFRAIKWIPDRLWDKIVRRELGMP